MIAVDTNLIIRILTNDDPLQAKRAVKVFESDTIFVPKTVLLESEWVLRYAYDIEKQHIIIGFKKLLGLPNVAAEDASAVQQAMAWYENGLDFADALHLASSKSVKAFATFDNKFSKKAGKLSKIRFLKP
jgi:predicted nucleic-acid-binding protein